MYANDPELNGKYLGTISQDFVKVADIIYEAAYQIKKRGISDYPIFPMCKENQPIGALLIPSGRLQNQWNYYASFLSEFVERGLVDVELSDDFKAAYKNPEEYACLFVIDPEFTKFVFIPYPED
ncbi:MAG: hypothetical protein RMJ44_12340 [Cytophagales bacterium]|nr:hypothetical protein [Bernardetiaceae bacterium]MDW8211863.1 hypothetical protein [Cytophagales bacterium]